MEHQPPHPACGRGLIPFRESLDMSCQIRRGAGALSVMAALCVFAAAPLANAASPGIPTTTRKVVLEKLESGTFGWKLIEAAVPTVGEHQVLVHVRAVSLNRGDLEMFDGGPNADYAGRVAGSDAAGDVVAIGSQVKGVRVGARVTSTYFRNWIDGPPNRGVMQAAHGANVDGVIGDYIVLEDTAVVPIAKGLSYEEASTLPTAGLTGYMATVGRRDLRAGDVVLVQGTGGVSVFAAQFASAAGARVIITSSSDDKLRKAQSFGAKDGINYKTVPVWSARVMELTNGHGADVIVDVGGKSTLEQSVKSLAFSGTLSLVGGLTGYDGQIPAGAFIGRSARAQGIYVGSRADFERMNAFIERHNIHPVLDRTFALDRYADALALMAAGDFVGKIVLKL
jgi:NADPH:quinone reductase-like Zn-dependent oxidoreductase